MVFMAFQALIFAIMVNEGVGCEGGSPWFLDTVDYIQDIIYGRSLPNQEVKSFAIDYYSLSSRF